MSGQGQFPGCVFTQWYPYNTRFAYGQAGGIQVISAVAAETLPPGVLVEVSGQATGGIPLVQVVRGTGNPLAGVVVYDPDHFDHSVIYSAGDVIPVLRKGSAFVQFAGALDPLPLQTASYYAGEGMGMFSTDEVATPLAQAVFSITSKDYYMNSDGSPAADIPYPVPPLPPGIANTTFGSGVALVDINL